MNSAPESAAPEGESHATQAPHAPVNVIDDRDEYLAAVAAIAEGHGPIGIDAERASGYRYSQRAYLIQIFRRGAGTFLFDPPAIGDFVELNDLIADEEWILHAATQDLTCLREVGLHPSRLFDTELGARLAGLPRVGLGTVVEHLLGIHLAKEHSSADWSTRPLPQAWLVYAALDVELLVDLREALGELLDSADKHDIAQQEFDSVLSRDLSNVRAEPWRRLSGVHSLRGGKNLAIARELWLARDAYAQEVDTAPGRLVPDSALLAAARFLPESKRQLSAMKEFSGRASRTQIDRWWDAIQAGLASTDIPASRVSNDALPPPRVWSDKNPEADLRLKAARATMSERSEELSIPIENLLTPDYLRRVAWTPPADISAESVSEALQALGARQWQIDVSAQSIAQAFVEAHQTPEESDDTES
ncbi:HRDC domain-containing protein [Salinibacterium sp. PAMC 21357]|uniref:HRDC domain-containing protein n=1 Tax=Salinibacterium sp. PAMC 21357 TaxID=1112215 RepID=UPI0002888A85|nr:HRDC domain-containing protein [Salinibacterium sp. PAMC 21357]